MKSKTSNKKPSKSDAGRYETRFIYRPPYSVEALYLTAKVGGPRDTFESAKARAILAYDKARISSRRKAEYERRFDEQKKQIASLADTCAKQQDMLQSALVQLGEIAAEAATFAPLIHALDSRVLAVDERVDPLATSVARLKGLEATRDARSNAQERRLTLVGASTDALDKICTKQAAAIEAYYKTIVDLGGRVNLLDPVVTSLNATKNIHSACLNEQADRIDAIEKAAKSGHTPADWLGPLSGDRIGRVEALARTIGQNVVTLGDRVGKLEKLSEKVEPTYEREKGKTVKIVEMNDAHLKNAILKCLREETGDRVSPLTFKNLCVEADRRRMDWKSWSTSTEPVTKYATKD